MPHVFYSGDYNPEQWPEEVWKDNDEAADIRLPVPGRDLLTDKEQDAMMTLDPLGVAVLREVPGT
jgi:beta-galactosidase GanA